MLAAFAYCQVSRSACARPALAATDAEAGAWAGTCCSALSVCTMTFSASLSRMIGLPEPSLLDVDCAVFLNSSASARCPACTCRAAVRYRLQSGMLASLKVWCQVLYCSACERRLTRVLISRTSRRSAAASIRSIMAFGVSASCSTNASFTRLCCALRSDWTCQEETLSFSLMLAVKQCAIFCPIRACSAA